VIEQQSRFCIADELRDFVSKCNVGNSDARDECCLRRLSCYGHERSTAAICLVITLELAVCERHDMTTAIWDIATYEVGALKERLWKPIPSGCISTNATCCGIARLSRPESRSDEGLGWDCAEEVAVHSNSTLHTYQTLHLVAA